MHQYKTLARTLLLLSIFNLAFAVPVVREIHDARHAHNNMAVSVVVRNVAAVSKERGEPVPDESLSSTSSTPPSDGPTISQSSTKLQGGSTVLHGSSASDGSAYLHEGPPHPDGSTSLAVSSPQREIVPATDQPVPGDIASSLHPDGPTSLAGSSLQSEIVPATDQPVQGDIASSPAPLASDQHEETFFRDPETKWEKYGITGGLAALDTLLVGGFLWQYRHNLFGRTIEPDQ